MTTWLTLFSQLEGSTLNKKWQKIDDPQALRECKFVQTDLSNKELDVELKRKSEPPLIVFTTVLGVFIPTFLGHVPELQTK